MIFLAVFCRLLFQSNKRIEKICLFDWKWMRNKGDTKENWNYEYFHDWN